MSKYKIKFGDKEFPASEYQENIFNNIEEGVGNMVINAAAGASKTTTIINCLSLIPSEKTKLFIAFNKDIVSEIERKIGDVENVNVMTFHGLGLSIFKENYKKFNLDNINEFKYRNYIKNNIINLSNYHETKSLGRKYNTYIKNIIDLVEYSRYYLAFTKREIKNIAEKYGVVPIRDEFEVCRQTLLWGQSNIDTIDYTDMLWLPNVLNLTSKKNRFNWVFIDEAQDTSIVEQKLVEKCFKRGTRFVAVCDTFQQINVWCGATEEAIDNFKKKPNTKEFLLPITYRCPKKIVELAQQYSTNIKAAPDAIDGEINYNVSANNAVEGDVILCRNTAPLIEQHMKYMAINKKSYIRGAENIKERYLSLIKSTGSKLTDKALLFSNGMFSCLYTNLFKEQEKIMKNYGLDEDDALSHSKILQMYDDIEGIKALCTNISNVDELISKINIIFNGDNKNAIQLSTVHKAKGLEFDNVYILCPSLLPSKMAKKDWEIATERNLVYVAITRAKKSLNYIKEDGNIFKAGDTFNFKKMKDELNDIKSKIKYNKENGIMEIAPKQSVSIKQPTRKLGEKVNITNTPITRNTKKKGGQKFSKLFQ